MSHEIGTAIEGGRFSNVAPSPLQGHRGCAHLGSRWLRFERPDCPTNGLTAPPAIAPIPPSIGAPGDVVLFTNPWTPEIIRIAKPDGSKILVRRSVSDVEPSRLDRVRRALVSRVRSSLTKSGHAVQDFVSSLMPDKRFRCVVGHGQTLPNGGNQFARAAMDAAADLFVRQFDTPALDEMQPRGTRRCEVHVVAGALRQPPTDGRGLVRRIIVENQMHVQVTRDGAVDRVEEPAKLDSPMPGVALADDRPGLGIERGEERPEVREASIFSCRISDSGH
jgi:hypothetical protein